MPYNNTIKQFKYDHVNREYKAVYTDEIPLETANAVIAYLADQPLVPESYRWHVTTENGTNEYHTTDADVIGFLTATKQI